jgi:glycine/D-amino acid oxidase-like deaminating enzyme
MSIEGVEIIRSNITDLGIVAADPVSGTLSAARHPADAELRRDRDQMAKAFGVKIEVWPRERVREVLVSERYHEGLFQPDAFHFDPLAYAGALATEIERLGGKVFEGSPVNSLVRDGAAHRAWSAGGSVRARDVVLASGGYTGRLAPRLRSAYLPIATYVMLTKPAPELIAAAIRTRAAVGDRRRAGDYYRVVDGGKRILWGGKITTRTSEPRDLAEQLRQSMVSTYPQLGGLEVDLAWTGLMAYARHMMPQIARLEEGVWCCTAFGGHGMNTTAIGGRVVAEAISGETDRYRLFAPFGLTWNGGVFGRAAVQATYWTLQLQDAIKERGVT